MEPNMVCLNCYATNDGQSFSQGCPECGSSKVAELVNVIRARQAAAELFDNRLGWSEGRQPYAPRELWARLGAALYGDDDPRVLDLMDKDTSASAQVRGGSDHA